MRPDDSTRQRICCDWLSKAAADLALAEHLLPDAPRFANAIAFHCQQAAEKYLKALLTWRKADFPKTHDLDKLLDLVQPTDAALAERLRRVIALTPYGVELRYPADRSDVGVDEAHQSVALAQEVQESVLRALPPGLRQRDSLA